MCIYFAAKVAKKNHFAMQRWQYLLILASYALNAGFKAFLCCIKMQNKFKIYTKIINFNYPTKIINKTVENVK